MRLEEMLKQNRIEDKPGAGEVDFCPLLPALDLPEQYRRLILEVRSASIDGWILLDPQGAADAMRQMKEVREQVGLDEIFSPAAEEVSGEIRPVYWSDRWLPVFVAESGLLCLDLDPTPNGLSGQVIYVSTSGSERKLVARSLEGLADKVAKALSEGDLVWADRYGRGLELCSATGAWGVLYGED
jgi:hypothetical protein